MSEMRRRPVAPASLPAAMSRPPSVIPISRLGWCVIALVFLAPWALLVWQRPAGRSPAQPAPARTPERPAPAHDSRASVGIPGPWGRLAWTKIFVEPPEDFILPYLITPRPHRWCFPGFSETQLLQLWRDAAVPPADVARLQRATRREKDERLLVEPPADLVLNLQPATRARIYTTLARFPENPAQRDSYRCRADDLEAWLRDSPLSPDTLTLTRQLLYSRNNVLLFSDPDLVLARISSASDRIDFIKTVSRKSALLVELHVPHGADVDTLARFWGPGRRTKDIKPLLQSLAHRPEGGAIDIVHLLTPLARRLLYTYPFPSDQAAGAARDCHWTSFNFFNEQPDDRFVDAAVVHQTITSDYYQVGGTPAFGDIVMLVEPDGRAVHSCVYIADDIVFTKNGAAFSVPWSLAPLENVVGLYTFEAPLEVRRYRLKTR